MEVIVSGAEITVRYVEPVENDVDEEGNTTSLTDLKHTSVYSVIKGEKSKIQDVPASGPNGGGDVEIKFVTPLVGKREADIEIQVTATDLVGNESSPPTSKTVRIDGLPPKSPL